MWMQPTRGGARASPTLLSGHCTGCQDPCSSGGAGAKRRSLILSMAYHCVHASRRWSFISCEYERPVTCGFLKLRRGGRRPSPSSRQAQQLDSWLGRNFSSCHEMTSFLRRKTFGCFQRATSNRSMRCRYRLRTRSIIAEVASDTLVDLSLRTSVPNRIDVQQPIILGGEMFCSDCHTGGLSVRQR